jgi:2-amino-4-hydroxy-6-hydroxymethyldihydropteridine diphosphokinase
MIYIAIGANLPDRTGATPLQTCRWAAAQLAALPGLTLSALSGWYATAPIPQSDQPDYVNGVAALTGAPAPETLLAHLHAIEAQAGRTRTTQNAARPLDLDIIDLNGQLRDAPDPVLPHPRAHLRGFVLYPLADLTPAWVHPRSGTPIATLIGDLPKQHLRVLAQP